MPTIIAVDAMGSDKAPKPEIEGAILAARHYDVRVKLVGREDLLRAEMAHHPSARNLPIDIVHASESIGMHEKAAQAVRSKRDSSMRVGLRMIRDGEAAGFISAGNTGACMATAKMVLGTLPGVERPALAGVFPTSHGTAAVVIDIGANVDCKPANLAEFAVMGDVFYRCIFKKQHPRVGLLSVGEEEGKGNELTKEVFPLLKELPINFVGNVEGRDLYNGTCDVIVCDGFIGNVALKVSEGMAEAIRYLLKESLRSTISSQVGAILSRQAFSDFKKRIDYSEYGGAPLLGVKGVCIIGHGSSNSNAIKNGIRVAAEWANSGLNQEIEQEIHTKRANHIAVE